jgi:MAF protein
MKRDSQAWVNTLETEFQISDFIYAFTWKNSMNVILASNSPRRHQLLGLTGLGFIVIPADVDETPLQDESPADYVKRLAAGKAQAVRSQLENDALVIAADTTVVDDGQILGKPIDERDAARMLVQLRGRTHQVYTGLAVIRDGKLIVDVCGTDVPMRQYSDEEMQAYISSGDPLDKAGAYAIQHAGFHPVDELQGCYANVVGLPLCHLLRTLQAMNVILSDDIPQACQETLVYQCPIFEWVLRENK